MKIKATQDFQGSLDGFNIHFFEKGTILNIDDTTANIFRDAGYCEQVIQKPKSNVD